MASKTDLRPVFERLKEILAPYEPKMDLAQETDTMYMLNTRYLLKNNYPLMFGGVRLGKNYVSFHLFSVYTTPGDAQTISPELKKRMQGKACFNFTAVDEPLFRELAKLTKAGAKRFSDAKFLEGLRQAQAAASEARKKSRPA
ncbi:MAG TPA: hypothetical protein VN696_14485 [Pyrinomonadaceae bacterium]|nr:hypothetical protein [Pyrinomonadaceae bacterium]